MPTLDAELNDPQQTGGATLPRLLAGVPALGAMSLAEHHRQHGPLPTIRTGRRRGRPDRGTLLIDEIERAGLLGHGGAAFPAARKMRTVASARGRSIVLGNAAEGEPASGKDRLLLEAVPHMVLDGGLMAAEAVDADELVICVCESAGAAFESMALAIEERELDPAYARSTKVRLTTVPHHYVAGQESSLVNYVGGGPAMPTFTPPMPYERGLKRRPTLINNVETLAHVALIARYGAAWFRQLGTPAQPGTALVTLSGAITHPGVYEVEHGTSLSELIDAAGGAPAPVRAALFGGYAGAWVAGDRLEQVALSNADLARHGASLGAGVVVLLSDRACPVAETARVARWMAGQSVRQCGPCTHGLDSIADTLQALTTGMAAQGIEERIERLAVLAARRGACAHPDGAVRLILSALDCFSADFAIHAQRGPCGACTRGPELPLPDRPVDSESARRREARR